MTTIDPTADDAPSLSETETSAAELAIPEETTGEVVTVTLDEPAALALTNRIRGSLVAAHDGLVAAFKGRAWIAMGYKSWHAYCKGEFQDAHMVRLESDQRQEIVAQMRSAGMSTRAIGSALGVSQSTVVTDTSVEQKNYLPRSRDGTESNTSRRR